METPATNSTLTYKLLCYRQELRRPRPVAKKIVDTKINLTVGLIGECCNNMKYNNWNDLDAFIRQAKFRKFLCNARECLWPKGDSDDEEEEEDSEEKAKVNKIVLDHLKKSVKIMDFL